MSLVKVGLAVARAGNHSNINCFDMYTTSAKLTGDSLFFDNTTDGNISEDDLLYYDESTNNITNHMLCAGVPESGKDSCYGNSGGPLIVQGKNHDQHVFIGVVSWGLGGCGVPNYPGIYALCISCCRLVSR